MRTIIATTMLAASLALAATAAADNGGRPLSATMTGDEEAPGPGDEDGSGTADFRVNPGRGEVCYTLIVSGIDPATAAHIHRAPPGSPGPVVVGLAAPSSGTSSGCASVDRALARELIQDPESFYVNVHNATFPGGAVRGQLER